MKKILVTGWMYRCKISILRKNRQVCLPPVLIPMEESGGLNCYKYLKIK